MIFSSIRDVFYTLVVIFSFSLVGCNDEPTLISESINPDKDIIQGNTYLVGGLKANNVMKESIISDKVAYTILGEFNDPLFGYSKGEFVTQINAGAKLDSSKFNLPNYYLDHLSLNLVQRFNSWYGDPAAFHQISVYELTEPLANDLTTYYSNTSMEGKYNSTSIGAINLKTNRNNDTVWSEINGIDTIRIELSQDLATRFFNEVNANMISDNKAFRDWFKGVYIKSTLDNSSSSEGSLLNLQTWGKNLGLKLYYYHMKDGDTTKYRHEHLFPISFEGTDYNIFKHEKSTEIDTISSEPEHLYCQGMAGSYTHIELPDDIFDYADSLRTSEEGYQQDFASVTLELYVDVVKSDTANYVPPQYLQLYRYNEVTKKLEVPFLHSDSKKYTNVVTVGVYNTSSASYKFNISNDFFKRVVTKDDELPVGERKGKGEEDDFQDIYIGPTTPSYNFNRVVLFGKDKDAKQRVEFKIRMVKYLSKI